MDEELENVIEEDFSGNEESQEETDFKGEFHERDKLTENNIVDEILS